MLPIIAAFLRSNAVLITLPIATVIGTIGYYIESGLSSKHTPYSQSIQENRAERLASEIASGNPTKFEKLKLNENVLERNLPPSLQKKASA